MSNRQNKAASSTVSVIGSSLVFVLLSSASSPVLAAAATAADAAADPQGSTSVESVVVTAPRQEEKARALQLQAPNIINVQSAETIAKYPDFNAAEALGRMPGISLSTDTGEGRFVQIRGIDANLNGATYGGVPLLNTNPGGTAAGGGGRAVEFDTIPTGAIDGIIVTLTGTPDHEAEGLGGTIELSPRTAANITKPFLDATLGDGYEPLHDHEGPFDAEVAVGARFGFGDHGLIVQDGSASAPDHGGFFSNPTPFSFVLNASRKEDRRAIDDLEEGYIDDGLAPSNAVSEYDLRRYDYHRTRFGYGGEFDFQPNEDHAYYARADVAGYTESVHKNFLLFKKLDAVEGAHGSIPVDPNDPNGFLVTTTPEISLTDEEETHQNLVAVLGGRDRFGDVLVDYRAAYSRATYKQDHSLGATFNGPSNTPITYDNVANPDFPIITLPGGTNINDPSIYNLASIKNSQQASVDEEYSYAANLSFPVHLIGDDDRLKFGVEARLRYKVSSEYDFTYTTPPLNLANASTPAIRYYDGHFSDGPQIIVSDIYSLINAPGASSGPQFNQGSFFNAHEDIYAGYGMYTAQLGPWGLLAGVRVEATDASYGGFIQQTAADGSTANIFETRAEDYIDAFPTVQLRYSFTPKLILRGTYSTGIARPGFNQNTTAASVDLTQDPAIVTRGNPNLKPTLGQNFDLSLEDYLPNGGILQFGAFDKEFTNYIAPRIQNGVMDPLAPGELANVTTFLNIPSAYARGLEAAYHQKFTWLAKPFDGFGVESNITIVNSHILEYTAAQSLSGRAEYGPLPGTSAQTWNMAGFYEAYGFEARIAAEYVSHSLFGLGGDRTLDTIQDNRLTADFTSSYQITPNWAVYFNAKNLTNQPLRYYEGSSNRPLQREFYDATYEAGVKVHF